MVSTNPKIYLNINGKAVKTLLINDDMLKSQVNI